MKVTPINTQVIVLSPEQLQDCIFQAVEKILQQLPKATAPPKSQTVQETSAPDELLSITKACSMLEVSRPTIRAWVKKGLLSQRRIGRRIFLLRSDLLKQTEEVGK